MEIPPCSLEALRCGPLKKILNPGEMPISYTARDFEFSIDEKGILFVRRNKPSPVVIWTVV
jgi:hypothetical protein